ncbi:HIT family protein [Clostridium estertheticum]|uniref:HIT family protein n=1 Tax=Clostridium estertheticum TaxID=238834 RepID=UPI001C0E73F9|nr:HIT family protein [Clostridium estertheticum]MBU3072901.1 HIT family protein [Clostridium estertheticum]MBU3163062.1 HIT family protein [Clostridium estertheticum]
MFRKDVENEKCLFCKIVTKKISSFIIYEDDLLCCFLDIEPINEGHILIVPKKHYLDIDELDKETSMRIMEFSIVMTKAIKSIYNPDGYTIMQNGGVFNDIGHYHLHIFPRYENDGFGWKFDNIQYEKDFNAMQIKFKNELQQYI